MIPRLLILLLGLAVSACYMDRIPMPRILTNGQDLERYQARVGDKINLTVVLAVADSFVKPGDPNQKTYGILYDPSPKNNSDCFNLKPNPLSTSTTPFCPAMAKHFKGLVPDVAPSAPAKAVELTYNSSTKEWVGQFQIEAVELCTDPPGCVSTHIGVYGASTGDPKTIFPLSQNPDDSVAIFVNP